MKTLNKKVLVSLFELAQADVPASVQEVATCLNMSRREAAIALNSLVQLGLVRAETLRLTFPGLMKAVGLASRRAQSKAA